MARIPFQMQIPAQAGEIQRTILGILVLLPSDVHHNGARLDGRVRSVVPLQLGWKYQLDALCRLRIVRQGKLQEYLV